MKGLIVIKTESVWTASIELPHFECLERDLKTNVLIIGGGMAGILCAHSLNEAGIDCVLVEAGRICSGITKNTTAKITSQHGLIYDKLIREFGAEKAQLYYRANEEALKAYCKLCEKIDCDFKKESSFVYSLNGNQKLDKELTALKKIAVPARFKNRLPLPFSVAGAIEFENQAQFNPLKFVAAIVLNLKIYENTAVRELVGTTAITDFGKITAKNIIVATHFPFINKHGSYYIKMYQQRSYVIALEGSADVKGMYIDCEQNGLSFRTYDNMLFIGGGGHRTGKKGGSYRVLEDFAKEHYPDAKIKFRWATQDCMTLDSVPYIGQYSGGTKGLYVATGFNKWGMTSSMIASMLLRDEILGMENEFCLVFLPSRTILRPQLAANAFESLINLLTPSSRRCPHLGCALKWNAAEHSWDCPCHGSRFTKDGKLIDNPATGDFK